MSVGGDLTVGGPGTISNSVELSSVSVLSVTGDISIGSLAGKGSLTAQGTSAITVGGNVYVGLGSQGRLELDAAIMAVTGDVFVRGDAQAPLTADVSLTGAGTIDATGKVFALEDAKINIGLDVAGNVSGHGIINSNGAEFGTQFVAANAIVTLANEIPPNNNSPSQWDAKGKDFIV
ncbi:MAG: hypothetical protein DWQ42_06635 [Planctomycetota bacterium]|nr:MAG: hypothetical protein DWQ42_06635 [Planctomycetota bacterium]